MVTLDNQSQAAAEQNKPQAGRLDRALAVWLLWVAVLVFAMVLLGGTTRLTHSGLSMVHWKPLTGFLPPLDATTWTAEFEAYKQFPEYQKINQGMSLAEFKGIFWFEYSHRLLGRIIGLAFALPFLWFLIRRRISWRRLPVFLGLFVLGGMQGVVGWWMVKSGLAEQPDVSQYRLGVHLGLAVLIIGALLWVAASLLETGRKAVATQPHGLFAWLLLAVVFLQILSGAIVAGLDGGMIYNTFPMMDAHWMAPEVFSGRPLWRELLENPVTAQFDHRLGAYLVVILGLLFLRLALKAKEAGGVGVGFEYLAGMFLLAQIGLGIATLMLRVPVVLGVLHQAGGLGLFCCLVMLAHQRTQRKTRLPGRLST